MQINKAYEINHKIWTFDSTALQVIVFCFFIFFSPNNTVYIHTETWLLDLMHTEKNCETDLLRFYHIVSLY